MKNCNFFCGNFRTFKLLYIWLTSLLINVIFVNNLTVVFYVAEVALKIQINIAARVIAIGGLKVPGIDQIIELTGN